MRAGSFFGYLSLACLFGCSAVNPPEAHVADPVDATEFCEAYANVACEGFLGCCSEAGAITRDQCIAVAGVLCTSNLSPLIGDPRTGYDEGEAGVQLAIGQLLADSCDLSFSEWLWRRDGLSSVFTGSVDEGEGCGPVFREDFSMGIFDTPRFFSCGVESACGLDPASAWRCLPPRNLGSACVADCANGLACLPASGAFACQPRLPDGAQCGLVGHCESYDCQCANPMDPATCTCQPDDTVDQVYCDLAASP